MTLQAASPAHTTTTLYSYAEQLARRQEPRAATLRLGMRWSFGFPAGDLETLSEYSLPANPTPLSLALARRGGVRIDRHAGDAAGALYAHLATGAPAIVAVDAFHFPFRPAYRRVHSSRTVLVTPAAEGGRLRVEDSWGPPAVGEVSRDELEAARFSAVPLDVDREPLFSGNPVAGVWFTVGADPFRVDDAAAWSRERLGCLYDEMARPRSDEHGDYGLAALRRFQGWIAERLAGDAAAPESLAARRGASLLLRPELSSRLYLGVFLRNAAHLLGDDGLRRDVELYRAGLAHLQSALDVLTKTIRTRRPEYDDFIRDRLALAYANEERLLHALSRYSP